MTRKVGVVGQGHVGETLANNLLVTGTVDELVLIDTNEKKLNANATDFEDAEANLPTHTKVVRNDYNALKDADVVVIAVGNIGVQKDDAKHDRFVELNVNSTAAKEVGTKLKEVGFNGVLVSISNPCDVIAALFQKYTGLPKNQVIGTGTYLILPACGRQLVRRWTLILVPLLVMHWVNTGILNLQLGPKFVSSVKTLLTLQRLMTT